MKVYNDCKRFGKLVCEYPIKKEAILFSKYRDEHDYIAIPYSDKDFLRKIEIVSLIDNIAAQTNWSVPSISETKFELIIKTDDVSTSFLKIITQLIRYTEEDKEKIYLYEKQNKQLWDELFWEADRFFKEMEQGLLSDEHYYEYGIELSEEEKLLFEKWLNDGGVLQCVK